MLGSESDRSELSTISTISHKEAHSQRRVIFHDSSN